jgi:hypothetical protein
MLEEVFMKRLLVVAILVGMVLAGTLAAQDRSGQAALRSWGFIEGTWSVYLTYYYEGTTEGFQNNLQFLQQFNSDGRTVMYKTQPRDAEFDDSRTACAGEWKRVGRHTFDATLYCFWQTFVDEPAVPDRILMKVELAPDGQSWKATPFYYQQYDGSEFTAGPGWGDMTGVRLGIVPIP